ncbi:MAG TPA: hypothetical protein ENG30_01895, partial [Thermofilaceae archaeon]|nr:hypothetical protein [Thermofilaceae archaeon]
MEPSALLVMGDDVAACLLVHAYRKFDRKSRVILVARTRDLGYSHRLLPYYSVGLTTSLRMFSQQLLELVDTVRVVLLDEIELVGMDRVIIRGEVNPLSRLVIAGWLAPHPYRRQVLHLSNPQSAEELRDLLEAGLRSVVVLEGLGALPLVDALVRVGIRPIFVLGSKG